MYSLASIHFVACRQTDGNTDRRTDRHTDGRILVTILEHYTAILTND